MKFQTSSACPFIPLGALTVTAVMFGVMYGMAYKNGDHDEIKTPFWLWAAIIFSAGSVFCYIAKSCCSCYGDGHDTQQDSYSDTGSIYSGDEDFSHRPWYKRLASKLPDWLNRGGKTGRYDKDRNGRIIVGKREVSHAQPSRHNLHSPWYKRMYSRLAFWTKKVDPSEDHQHVIEVSENHLDCSDEKILRKLDANQAELYSTYHDPSDDTHWRVIERRATKMMIDVKALRDIRDTEVVDDEPSGLKRFLPWSSDRTGSVSKQTTTSLFEDEEEIHGSSVESTREHADLSYKNQAFGVQRRFSEHTDDEHECLWPIIIIAVLVALGTAAVVGLLYMMIIAHPEWFGELLDSVKAIFNASEGSS